MVTEALTAAPRTPFIGRAADLDALRSRLAEHGLVTLWGPAGMGKTRLALEVAQRWLPSVLFCDLADAESRAAVCGAVAAALDAPLDDGGASEDAPARVGRILAARDPTLVVLDNFEQVAHAAPYTVLPWMSAAPRVRFLITSRQRLKIRGEVAHELSPLGLPGSEPVERCEAVQLLLASAAAFAPGFQLTADNTAAVGDLVRHLEGIPLAIELAAARLEVLGTKGLLERMGRQLEVLAGGYRDFAPRQRALRTAIRWSWDLLDPFEQQALVECAVFRGGFTLDACEHVLTHQPSGPPIIDLVQALRDQSLVRIVESPAGMRLGLFESVREFAAEQMASSGRDDPVARRHSAYFVDLGREVALGSGAAELLSQVAEERENLIAVVERETLRAEPDAASVARATSALLSLEPVLSTRGPGDRLPELIERVMGLGPPEAFDPSSFARLLAARGRAAARRGQFDAARGALEQASERAGDAEAQTRASIMADLGVLHHQLRNFHRARECYDVATSIAVAAGDARAEARLLGNLGALLHDTRQYEAALEHYEDALSALCRQGDDRLEGIVSMNVGILLQEQGNLEEAAESYGRSLELLARARDRRLEAIAFGNLGTLELERGRPERGLDYHQRALEGLRAVGDLRSEALALTRLAQTLATLDRAGEARSTLASAEALGRGLADPVTRACIALGRAFIEVASARHAEVAGQTETASAHIARAHALMNAAHEPAPGGPAPAEVSDDIRIALRLLTGQLAEVQSRGSSSPSDDALVIEAGAARFKPPGGPWVDLGRHPVLRRILAGLVDHRHAAPGRGLSLEAVQRLAWPGERIRPDAAANRIYVAVSKLRRQGLRQALHRNEEGYFLDPRLEVRRNLASSVTARK